MVGKQYINDNNFHYYFKKTEGQMAKRQLLKHLAVKAEKELPR